MRYIDSGARNPAHTLATWIESNLFSDPSVCALRWQSAFFGSETLSLFAPSMKIIAACDGVLRLLVGSNDGCTKRIDIEQLLAIAGPPRSKRQIGIVKFTNAYFHPKTIHLTREDGSEAAYVGSANLTKNGVALNIEAGVTLDTRDGDDNTIVSQIRQAIDAWFATPQNGLYSVSKSADLDALVKLGVLDVPPPVPPPSASKAKHGKSTALSPLFKLPKSPKPPAPTAPSTGTTAAIQPAKWVKKLSASDAQRKKKGNQRGGITLVTAGHPIDRNTYFRYELFKNQHWTSTIKKKKKLEHCFVEFKVDFLGKNLGLVSIEISHEKGRESGQHNYISELHLGPVLGGEFKAQNVTGKWLRLARSAKGEYSLSVLASAPP